MIAAGDDHPAVDILLVEDSDTDAELVHRALRRISGDGGVVRVRDGVDALDFVLCQGPWLRRTGGHPRLILLDMKMPRLNGLDVLRRLKGDESTRVIPVVMLTSSQEARDIRESYQLGANSYLVKPVDAEGFAAVVAHAGRYWTEMNHTPA